MRPHAPQTRSAAPQRPKDRLAARVVALFIGLGAAALVFGWLEQPEEFRKMPGTLTSMQPRKPGSMVVVSVVKLDDGRVVTCSRLPNFGVGSRVVVSIAKTGFLGREIMDC